MHKGILGFVMTLALGVSGAAQAEGAFSGRVGAGFGTYQFDDTLKDGSGTVIDESDDSDTTFGLLLGSTLGVGRFFADVGIEYSQFGQDQDIDTDGDGFADDTITAYRTDGLLNLGYFIGDRWVVFVGYRHATFGDGFFSDEGGNTEDGPFFGGGFSFRAGNKLSFGASLAYNALTLKIDGQAVDDLDLNGVSAKLQMNVLETPHSVYLRFQFFRGTLDEPGVFEYEYNESYFNLGYQATFDFTSW